MSVYLNVIEAGPAVLIQDLGRPGFLVEGLSQGGAADRLALFEGAALLGQSEALAALELGGYGGAFTASAPLRFAVTGARMQLAIDGAPILMNASYTLHPGQTLRIGAAKCGVYGYLHLGGGLDTPSLLGSRATHLGAGIGKAVASGDTLPVGRDPHPDRTGNVLDVADRCSGGALRMVASVQTGEFARAELDRFQQITFQRDARGNRQGVRLSADAEPFTVSAGLKIVSEMIVPGDIQITGDGAPYILLAECQTTGGYPRIGTVIPCDLPRVAQASPGTKLRFELIDMETALAAYAADQKATAGLAHQVRPLVRDPHDIADLLSYQLISGVTAGHDPISTQEDPK
ncbi:5-oxoprolinase subunit C (plasmid) [Pseudoseohaeicola sp. NH-UV-7]|uniref:5-oxoprolinase subunit C family protein n=1 Tax=Sulfitobacter sp. TBRI5 TaxID=2989732 RepID=UPI003A79228D